MKKFLLIFISLIFAFALQSPLTIVKNNAQAASLNLNNYQMAVLNEYGSSFKNRMPGSEGEKAAADYIKTELDKIAVNHSNFAPVQSHSTVDGVQEFVFNSIFSGINAKSQNIIYYYKSHINTQKKVVVACNYDAIALDYDVETLEQTFVESESINSSAGSVATLLAFAKSLPELNLAYNVEIIFFGAGESANAGSDYYVKGVSSEVKEDILCMINLDNIAVGESLYFYVDEVDTKFSDFIGQNLKDNKSKVSQIDVTHLGKTLNSFGNKLGLTYDHVAILSDNVNFMAQGITTLNLFAGAYDDGIVYGRSEYTNAELVAYTANDNLEYIKQTYGEDCVEKNLGEILSAMTSILQNKDFVAVAMESQNANSAFYAIFGNQTLVAYLSFVVLIVMIMVINYLHLKFAIKSYNADVEPEFLNTVLSISQNVDETCQDENVPKIVSQVVANDIRKDKTIKANKKKKKDS